MSDWQASSGAVAQNTTVVLLNRRQRSCVVESGTATGAGSGSDTLADTAKAWTVNGWGTGVLVGATITTTGGPGAGQTRTIASNTATQITLAGGNWAVAVGAGTTYELRQELGDFDVSGQFDGGVATAGSASTLTDSGKAWTVNGLAGKLLQIVSGPGAGQMRRVQSNTATVITRTAINSAFNDPGDFGVAPAAGSVYRILEPLWGPLIKAYTIGCAASAAVAAGLTLRSRFDAVTTPRTLDVVPSIVGATFRPFNGELKCFPNSLLELVVGAIGAGGGDRANAVVSGDWAGAWNLGL
jgi:hypothetical protein